LAAPGDADRRRALVWFAAATLGLLAGLAIAIARYPGGYDWLYATLSRLASARRNPEGGLWACGALLLAGLLLWPVARFLERRRPGPNQSPGTAAWLLRIGLVAVAALGLEGLAGLRDSERLGKTHEAIALVAFIGLYAGLLGNLLRGVKSDQTLLAPALLAAIPLCAAGIVQLVLYFDQRDLGWVDVDWREMGVPFWLSFAFWQWVAAGFFLLALGWLVAADKRSGDSATRNSGEGR